MWYKKAFDLNSRYQNVNEIIQGNKHISSCLSNYDKFDKPEDMSFDDLDNIIYRSEKIALTLRNAMEYKEKNGEIIDENYRNNYAENNPVSVEFNDRILKIYAPFTFKRMYRDGNAKENYILMNYVKAALFEWQKQNKIDLFQVLKTPLDVFIIRRLTKWNKGLICDHDNLENGRIINEIFEVLGYSDSAKNVDIHCMYRDVEDTEKAGTLFVIKERLVDIARF